MSKYVIGVDFGTQSGRAVVISVDDGKQLSEAVTPYRDGVIDEFLPGTDIKLSSDWALQNPDDYIDVLFTAVPEAIKKSGVNKGDIVGIGIDFTACTMMPVSKDGKVLCQMEEFKNNPHAWIKLWKHHAAQSEANKLNEIAKERGEDFLQRYGGKISSEWLIPKIWQILNEAPEIYNKADKFMEATDWVTMQMTGVDIKNSCTAGYKAIWNKRTGYPSKEFFKALDPKLENLVEQKLNSKIVSIGSKAGELIKEMADNMGLNSGTAVCVGNVDAHVSAPAVNVVEPGNMLMIMGTSICDILLGTEEKMVPGMCGVVEDGAVPGFFAYEAGQSAVGDIFEWYVDNCVPEEYKKEALEKGVNIHSLLEEKASKLKPGESGLLALDWLNGNRSVLVDTDLTGIILGLTLLTRPEEIYRSLIEATAYGKNMIIETFENSGVPIKELYACGGLPQKNKMLMQIYSDVTNKRINISASPQTPALGAAMFAAVAAGKEKGGYDDIFEAAKNMAKLKEEYYEPIKENVEIYKKLYNEYKKLHDYFGRGENNVMKTLKNIKSEVSK
ncbi:ribulokinase [Clostridium sp. JS66]|uniref:ribulokinase n=1 Tax=Clostridium sp. JS66 TaxID=3064705 RepID=UPI00298E8108|nr:ribulokinase [Clostridium sp. JS66]WPC39347.1 ribulokinase [Clostridium sp. JS66]